MTGVNHRKIHKSYVLAALCVFAAFNAAILCFLSSFLLAISAAFSSFDITDVAGAADTFAAALEGLWTRGVCGAAELVEDCVDNGEETRGEVNLGDRLALGDTGRVARTGRGACKSPPQASSDVAFGPSSIVPQSSEPKAEPVS